MSITSKDVQYNLIANTAAAIIVSGKPYMIQASDTRFEPVVKALREKNFDLLPKLLDVATQISTYMKGGLVVEHGGVYYNGEQLDGPVINRVLDAMKTDKDYSERLLAFIEKLQQNPSRRSIEQLYNFLEHKGLAISEDGDVFGYKGLSSDYRSIRAGAENVEVSDDNGETWRVEKGHIPNKVGSILRMRRSLVMDNPDVGCSVGLHVGSLEYASSWAGNGKVVIVKFNPANAVSVPNDCSCQKLRTCEYKVVGDCEGRLDVVGADSTNLYSR